MKNDVKRRKSVQTAPPADSSLIPIPCPLPVHVRWMIRRDFQRVLDIEFESHEFPWHAWDFVRVLRQRNCIGMVAEAEWPVDSGQWSVKKKNTPTAHYPLTTDHSSIVGYMIYELDKTRIHVVNFTVAFEFRRRGVGAAMIATLIAKLHIQRRRRIVLKVRESNLPAQQFLRAQGFHYVRTRKGVYDPMETSDDEYEFVYQLPRQSRAKTPRRKA